MIWIHYFCNQKTGKYTTTIAVDGSLFKNHPQFKRYMQETLREILPQANITLMLSKDGSGRGAALIAAVAQRMYSTWAHGNIFQKIFLIVLLKIEKKEISIKYCKPTSSILKYAEDKYWLPRS